MRYGSCTWLILGPSSTGIPKIRFPFNWWDLPLAVALLLAGLVLGRKKGYSKGSLIAFAIAMIGMVLLDVVAAGGDFPRLPQGVGVSVMILVSVFLAGVGLYRRRFLAPYLLAAIAVFLIAMTFAFNTGNFATALMFGLAFLLLLGGWAVLLLKKREPHAK